jgi:hypothetical protein
MKPPISKPREVGVFARPTPKVTRLKPGKTLTPAERAAFLASRPDLKTSE